MRREIVSSWQPAWIHVHVMSRLLPSVCKLECTSRLHDCYASDPHHSLSSTSTSTGPHFLIFLHPSYELVPAIYQSGVPLPCHLALHMSYALVAGPGVQPGGGAGGGHNLAAGGMQPARALLRVRLGGGPPPEPAHGGPGDLRDARARVHVGPLQQDLLPRCLFADFPKSHSDWRVKGG